MEGGPGDANNTDGSATALTKEEATAERATPLAVTRSASRIPLPTGEHGARSATHLASLMAGAGTGGPGPPAQPPRAGAVLMTPGGLPVLAEGGSSLASPAAASPATASPARHPSDILLDQRDHAPLDIRDSGDCAQMGPSGEQSALGLRAQGDATGAAAPSAMPQLVPSATLVGPSSAPVPHALLVQAVCSRSRLGATTASSGELTNTTQEETREQQPSHSLTAAAPTLLLGGYSRSTTFDVNASDVYLSTSTSLDQGLAPPPPPEDAKEAPGPGPPEASTQRIPEVIVTDATPPSVTPPPAPAPPALLDVTLEPPGAPPPPPPTPAQSSAQTTPDRKASPVAPTANKKAKAVAPGSKTTPKAAGVVPKPSATRRLPAARLSTARLGGSTGNVGAAAAGSQAARGDESVTLIKPPPRTAMRPASARSVRSATTTGTVTPEHGAVPPPTKRPTQGAVTARTIPGATKSASATVNRKASVTARETVPIPRPELSAVRPKSTQGPHSARSKPSRELSSLSASGGGSGSPHAKVDVKAHGAQLDAKPEPQHAASKAVTLPRPQPRVSKDALLASAAGAGEDIAMAKGIDASQEVWPTCMSRLDEELKCMAAPYLVLVAELASRHGVLLDAIKDKDAVTHAEEAQFAVTLAHRQAEALRTAALQTDQVRDLLRGVCAEGSGMRALLEAENTELVRKLQECTHDLERERAAGSKVKTSKAAQDSSLKQMRTRIKELETKAEAKGAEDEAKLKEQFSQIHSLKEKLRARGAVLDQRTKELEAVQAKIADVQSLESAKQQLDKRLGSVTQMLQIETKTREKAQHQLKATTEKLSQMEVSRPDADLEEIRAERDCLKAQLEELTERNSSDLSQLRTELTKVMEQLESRSRQLENKDAELQHYLSLRPGETNREELDALKETFAQLVTHNERLEQELSLCRQGLAQRDKVMTEQENVLRVRDHLINALHNRDQQGGALWPNDVVDGRRLIETNATLERKAVRCKAQEQHIKQLEKQVESLQNLRISMEKRNAQLEHLVAEFSKQALLSGKHCVPRCNVALM